MKYSYDEFMELSEKCRNTARVYEVTEVKRNANVRKVVDMALISAEKELADRLFHQAQSAEITDAIFAQA